MELSSGQQRGLFVAVVIVLAGLGVFLVTSRGNPGSTNSSSNTKASSGPGSAPASQNPAGAIPAGESAVPSAAATSAPTPGGTTVAPGQANIYDWLPFSQADLTSASKAALAFATDYGTWSYTESANTYIGKMNGIVTGQLANSLKASYATPQIASQRAARKQVSQGSGGIAQIRSFTSGSRSITFLVNIAQKLTSTQGTQTSTTQYAVTCVPGPGSWEINDIEYASAGNQ